MPGISLKTVFPFMIQYSLADGSYQSNLTAAVCQ